MPVLAQIVALPLIEQLSAYIISFISLPTHWVLELLVLINSRLIVTTDRRCTQCYRFIVFRPWRLKSTTNGSLVIPDWLMLVLHVSFHLLIKGELLFAHFTFDSFFLGVNPVVSLHVPGIPVGVCTSRILTFKELAGVYYLMGYEFCFSLEYSATLVFIALPSPFFFMFFFVSV